MALFDFSRIKSLYDGKKSLPNVIRGTLNTSNVSWMDAAGTGSAYVVGQESEVANFKVPPQQFHYWGYGTPEQPANQGYMYVSLMDDATTPVQIDGTILLRKSDANGINNEFVVSYDTANLRGSTTLRTQQIPLPAHPSQVAHINDFLKLTLKARTTTGSGTISKANSEFYIPESYGFE